MTTESWPHSINIPYSAVAKCADYTKDAEYANAISFYIFVKKLDMQNMAAAILSKMKSF